MGNPLVGAIFFGLLNGAANTGVPLGVVGTAQGLPTPQCVVCGPANRRAPGYHAARRLPGHRIDSLSASWRFSMNDAQVARITEFSGV